MIELTEHQTQTIPLAMNEPVQVVDPRTGKHFYLIGEQQFEDWQRLARVHETLSSIAPGVLRSMEAFWRDLQELLTRWRRRGKFVLYHHEQQAAFARSIPMLEKERIRRGIPEQECYIGHIVPQHEAPWTPEDMKTGLIEFDDEEAPTELQPGTSR
jgi:hypothetical protein